MSNHYGYYGWLTRLNNGKGQYAIMVDKEDLPYSAAHTSPEWVKCEWNNRERLRYTFSSADAARKKLIGLKPLPKRPGMGPNIMVLLHFDSGSRLTGMEILD